MPLNPYSLLKTLIRFFSVDIEKYWIEARAPDKCGIGNHRDGNEFPLPTRCLSEPPSPLRVQ